LRLIDADEFERTLEIYAFENVHDLQIALGAIRRFPSAYCDIDEAIEKLEDITIKELGIDKNKFNMDKGEYYSYCSLSLSDVVKVIKGCLK